MNSLIETFHIDWKLLIAQIINFGVVFCVLYFFALRPLLKIMGERSGKIAKSLQDGREIEKKLAQTQDDYQAKITVAKKEAGEILAKAGLLAEEQKKQIIAKAKEEIGRVIKQEKERVAAEKEQIVKEIKSEVADLVIASIEKILGQKAAGKLNLELIEKEIGKTE